MDMSFFQSEGTEIAYSVDGQGPPLLLVHGFASCSRGNWRNTGWIDMLAARGRQVIAIDCRGHGRSARPHGAQHYAGGAMQRDLLRLLDHLGIERVDYLGYSMGGWMVLPLLVEHESRFQAVVIAGAGAPLPETRTMHRAIQSAFDGEELAADTLPIDRAIATGFRAFAESVGNDVAALAGVLRSGILSSDMLKGLDKCQLPVLVIAGDSDRIAGDAATMSEAIPGSRLVLISGGDHLSTLRAPKFRTSVLDFLDEAGM